MSESRVCLQTKDDVYLHKTKNKIVTAWVKNGFMFSRREAKTKKHTRYKNATLKTRHKDRI
jgi:hypothetical protein